VAALPQDLGQLEHWDSWFESHLLHGCYAHGFVCCPCGWWPCNIPLHVQCDLPNVYMIHCFRINSESGQTRGLILEDYLNMSFVLT
jgi:hypothetical protein